MSLGGRLIRRAHVSPLKNSIDGSYSRDDVFFAGRREQANPQIVDTLALFSGTDDRFAAE